MSLADYVGRMQDGQEAIYYIVSDSLATARHSPQASAVLAKAASGAVEYVPFVKVTNLARALDEVKAYGFTVLGLDSEAARSSFPGGCGRSRRRRCTPLPHPTLTNVTEAARACRATNRVFVAECRKEATHRTLGESEDCAFPLPTPTGRSPGSGRHFLLDHAGGPPQNGTSTSSRIWEPSPLLVTPYPVTVPVRPGGRGAAPTSAGPSGWCCSVVIVAPGRRADRVVGPTVTTKSVNQV